MLLTFARNLPVSGKVYKNSAVLQGYMDKLKITPVSNTGNEAELLVKLNIPHEDINETCEIQSEDAEIYTFQWRPNIEEIGDVFVGIEASLIKEGIICKQEVDDKQDNNSTEIIEETEDAVANVEDYFVKEENTWKREEIYDTKEYPTDNNSTENMDNESDAEISVSDNAHPTNTESDKKEVDDKLDNNSTEIIEETADAVVNVEDYFVKEENTWKREVDDTKEYPTDNNSTENMDNESFAEISVSDNAHPTNTDFVSVHATSKNDLNTAAKKSFQCSTCSKSFFTKSALNIHTRIHTDEKSYECAICKTRFSQKANLIIHMRVHTHEKPYNCSRCKKCFKAKSQLVRHMRVHTGEKPYECTECKKCFTQHSNLARHMRIHTGEKPHECSKCKKCFTQYSNFKTHMRTHTGDKPHECSTCKKCFTEHSHLAHHMRKHTGEQPHECSKCKKCFTQQSSLERHMRIHTGK